ncbi:hypothetical protein [Salmonella enterica]|uniref:Uncharacterized protein n=1 Tax=Salmonella enterica subsp. enterica serovar Mbandaka TaxID=192954 RepID=A0A6Y5B0C3_SALET|nr:hypothetical protein [Salmonella enterica]EBU9286926.1 hypothetical protein [Salmonella enterica subsp. enterica serovar Mbandaka]EDI8620575.1 hypothetical protein [Salmonella enterica subsp. enterica serovar Mbandaka]EDZ9241991.1 hypothetical protein [Salmonella enterica]EEB4306832.1 hypothetical protein [Salmonella enterica]EEB9664828.1 hypothetical protein [Salmonella enterica]
MAFEQAVFTFYRINKAGYYAHGKPVPEFGNVTEMLADLQHWASTKTLKQTKTFEANEERYPCYLVDAKRNGDDWTLLMWNEIPTNGQQVPSISETARFGADPEVILNAVQGGSIPGYATYFWFLPERGLLATVRLHNKLTSQSSLQQYLHCFLKQSSQHVIAERVTNEDGSVEVRITGYKNNPLDPDEEKKHYIPKFSSSLVRNRGKHEVIKQNANRIKKIERIVELNLSKPEELGLWQRMLQVVHLGAPQGAGISTKVRYTVSPQVTLQDVNSMIADWESDPSEVNDYGFYFEGEANKPYWLSKSLARMEFQLDLERENIEFVQLDSLLSELVAKKNAILTGAGLL